jgi:hypothetical protein
MEDINTFSRKKQFGLRERGARSNFTLIGGGIPIGGNSNPGASISDIYDMHYINNNEIPPEHILLNKLGSVRFLRKTKNKKTKIKRKKCKCKIKRSE